LTVCVVAAISAVNIKIADIDLKGSDEEYAEKWIAESLPVIGTLDAEKVSIFEELGAMLHKAAAFVMTFDPFDPRTVVFGHLPLIHTVGEGPLAIEANGRLAAVFNPADADKGQGKPQPAGTPAVGQYPITEVDSGQAKALGKSKNKILIRNETDFGINIDEMLAADLKFDMSGNGPKVLIVHTHTTECYSPEGADTYSAEKSDRSLDETQNMIAVGEEVKRVFEENGIEVIHDKTIHDHPSFNGSYANSLKTVEKYKAKYPSISVVLDLHRDAFVYENGSKAKFVTEIDGQKVAQLMLVVGTNGGGLDHPEWRENMKLALKFQDEIIKEYPTLMRGVNLRKERFNGHTTYGSMIIEVGSSGNTLSEAIRGARLATERIAGFLNKL
jgi:stage II sporulation protein P